MSDVLDIRKRIRIRLLHEAVQAANRDIERIRAAFLAGETPDWPELAPLTNEERARLLAVLREKAPELAGWK